MDNVLEVKSLHFKIDNRAIRERYNLIIINIIIYLIIHLIKSYCFWNQRRERESEADRDIAMSTN